LLQLENPGWKRLQVGDTIEFDSKETEMADYAHPEALVSTDWVAQHGNDKNVRVVEVDVDTKGYDEGHVPGSIAWAWNTQLCDTVRRDILSRQQFEELMASSGVTPDTTLVIYGDNNNWFAAWALWQGKIYGHKDVRIMNGGRKKWLAEGRELSKETPHPVRTSYTAKDADNSLRAFLPQVQAASAAKSSGLVDVRSPGEFSGEILSPPGLPETCQRGGHIPGARSIPWGKACNDDGTFKTAEELKTLYGQEGIDGSKPVIAYCRIGERSSHSWFVLKYLLGMDNVSNYDGSWTEWGNLVGAPVERGATASAAKS
jgi:thiosulfate/3-mercaptopyruvate sulfurtransferase